jgi:sec-independent protein translocase protein TatB
MFDFSFGELVMIGAVALIVLGPERLPRVARAFGEMLGKAQRYVTQVRADFQREIELADLKRIQEEAQKATAAIDSSFKDMAASLNETARQASAEVSAISETSPNAAPVWSSSSWGSHRFRTRARPVPSLDELAEAIERLQGRQVMRGAGQFSRSRYAPRSRLNRPRIHR